MPELRNLRTQLARFAHQSLLLILLLGFGVALTQAETSAHARLESSDPLSGSALQAMPPAFVMYFSEDVLSEFLTFDLLAADGTEIPTETPEISDTSKRQVTVRVTDAGSAPAGNYSLVFRVISAYDSHPTTGAVTFSAGTGLPPDAAASEDEDRPEWWQVLARWLETSGWILVTGGAIFGFLHAPFVRGRIENDDRLPRSWLGVQRVALAVALVGLVMSLWNQAVLVSTGKWTDPPSIETFKQVLLESRFGFAWLIRLMMAGLILYLILLMGAGKLNRLSRSWWGIGALLGSIALFSFAWSGHAAADSRFFYATGNASVHLIVASVWLGGLPYLLTSMRKLKDPGGTPELTLTSGLSQRFSVTSVLAVTTLIVSGIINTQLHVSGPTAMQEQFYGRALIAKLLVIVPAVLSGAVNLLILRPRLRQAVDSDSSSLAASAARLLRATVGFEVAVAALIVLAAAVVTQSPPATAPMPVDVAVRPVSIEERQTAGDVSIWLLARLSGEIEDRFLVTLSKTEGGAALVAQRVIIDADLVESASEVNGVSERFDAEPVPDQPGSYAFPASRLGLEGEWDLRVIVRQEGLVDAEATFPIDTTGTAPKPQRMVEDDWRWPEFTSESWIFLLMTILMLVLGMFGLRSLRGLEPVAGAILLLITLMIAAGLAIAAARKTVPTTAGNDLANPLTPDAVVLREGGELFLNSCALCHGADGRSDDLGNPLHSHGEAADLTDDNTSLQSDGDLYYTISNGKVGTEMPAWDEALTEDERWAIVYHLRVLQGELEPE